MGRRSALAWLALGVLAACGRYRARVKFSLSTDAPRAGEPFEASIDFMDETDEPVAFVLLREGVEVERRELRGGRRRVELTARDPGPHSVELRWGDRMIAHRSVTVR